MSLTLIETNELEAMLESILARRLKPLEDKILYAPDETHLSDEEAATRKGVSVATLRRWKASGKIKSIPSVRGRVVRVCDVEVGDEPKG
jgi:DNA-binding transcriptional regulator YiaG